MDDGRKPQTSNIVACSQLLRLELPYLKGRRLRLIDLLLDMSESEADTSQAGAVNGRGSPASFEPLLTQAPPLEAPYSSIQCSANHDMYEEVPGAPPSSSINQDRDNVLNPVRSKILDDPVGEVVPYDSVMSDGELVPPTSNEDAGERTHELPSSTTNEISLVQDVALYNCAAGVVAGAPSPSSYKDNGELPQTSPRGSIIFNPAVKEATPSDCVAESVPGTPSSSSNNENENMPKTQESPTKHENTVIDDVISSDCIMDSPPTSSKDSQIVLHDQLHPALPAYSESSDSKIVEDSLGLRETASDVGACCDDSLCTQSPGKAQVPKYPPIAHGSDSRKQRQLNIKTEETTIVGVYNDGSSTAVGETEGGHGLNENDDNALAKTSDGHDDVRMSATEHNSDEGSSASWDSSSDEEASYLIRKSLPGQRAVTVKIKGKSLEERREIRVARNEARLKFLGLHKSSPERTKRGRTEIEEKDEEDLDEENFAQHPGMMFDTSMDTSEDDLLTRYPGREIQIRQLRSIINATAAQLANGLESTYVPPPIFVHGPGSVGKTSVVQDVVQSISRSPRIGSAYINCATLEPSSIEALVESAYRQIHRTFKESNMPDKKKTKRRRKTSKNKPPMARNSADIEEPEYNEATAVAMEDRIEQARALQSQTQEESQAIEETEICPRRSSRHMNSESAVSKKVMMRDNSKDKVQTTEASAHANHGAPLAFARSLTPFLGQGGVGGAFFVLDHAERLMTLAPNRSNSQRNKTNYLSQLVLLPKVMGLNLTMILISRNSLLMNSRIDNNASVDKASGVLNNGVHPIRIHFAAYSGNDTFKRILRTPRNLATFTGSGYYCNTDFRQLLMNSFLSALVQSMSGMTRDICDMLYAGRRLWPSYIEPLSSNNIEATMKMVGGNQEDKQKLLLSYLNQRMVKLSKNIESCLLSLDEGTAIEAKSELPYLSKFLLLAAFLCQHNKAEKDKQLFTITGNGRRRKRQQDEGEPENAAYATWDQQRTKMLKPRSFPLERMLSIFVNIVGLHEGRDLVLTAGATTSSFLSSLGHSVFLETLGQLRASGLLREIMSDGETSLSSAMYCCDMGKDDAESLAESVGFSLEQYLL